jgi:hypothetical protein
VPRRLRVRFVGAQAPLVLEAQRGVIDVTGAVQNLTYVPVAPAGEKGQWTLLTSANVNNTSWYWHAVDEGRDKIYWATWGGRLYSANRGTGVITQEAVPWSDGAFHNRTYCFDPTNDRIWIGGGTTNNGNDRQFWVNPSTFVATLANESLEPSTEAAHFYDPIGTGTVASPSPRMLNWGGWNNKSLSTKALSPTIGSWTAANVSGSYPPVGSDTSNMSQWRSVFDTRRRQFVTVHTTGALYILPAVPGTTSSYYGGWTTKETSGGPPPAATTYVYDESRDMIVGWCGINTAAGPGVTFRETWTLDMGTLVWTRRANAADGDTVPDAQTYVLKAASYDRSRQRTLLTASVGDSNETFCKVWAYTAPARPAVGTLTSIALPPASGSAWGSGNFGMPFIRFSTQKHVNITYVPDNNRLYAFGGDVNGADGSATDVLASMNCADGTWRVESIPYRISGIPMPSAWQDTCLMVWDNTRKKIVFVPRGHTGYGWNTLVHTTGYWTYDPLNANPIFGGSFGTWAQDSRLFNSASGTQGGEFQMNSGTGCTNGGIYDESTQIVYALRDSVHFNDSPLVSAPFIWRFNLGTGARLTDLNWRPANTPLFLTAGGRQDIVSFFGGCRVGRNAYWLCKGNSTELALFKMNFDTLTFSRLANLVVDPRQTYIPDTEATTRLVGCGSTHIVYVGNEGPEGSFPAIYVYNIAKDRWVTDTQVPWTGRFTPYTDGTIRYNAGCVGEGPNNGVAFSGTVSSTNGSSSTHMLFYVPTGVSA